MKGNLLNLIKCICQNQNETKPLRFNSYFENVAFEIWNMTQMPIITSIHCGAVGFSQSKKGKQEK